MSFARALRHVARAPRPEAASPRGFARQLDARPARIGFNLEDLQAVGTIGRAGLKQYRGRIISVSEDGVLVELGEIPSGRVYDAVLPVDWFGDTPLTPRRPIQLFTWVEGEDDQHEVRDCWLGATPNDEAGGA